MCPPHMGVIRCPHSLGHKVYIYAHISLKYVSSREKLMQAHKPLDASALLSVVTLCFVLQLQH